MSWDSTMRSKKERKDDAQMAHIVFSRFESRDTKDGTKYSIGGLYVRPVVTRVSKGALKQIKEKNLEAYSPGEGIIYSKLKVTKAEVTREHVIPVEELYKHFVELYERHSLTERYIRSLIPKLEIAIITCKENKKLVDAGLNSKMPDGWWSGKTLDPLDRYREAGLRDAIWAKDFY